MEIVFHIGAHVTDEGALLRSLLRNRERLADAGVVVPGPSRYRKVLRDVMTSLRGQHADPEAREIMLDAIVENDGAERVILFNDSFICIPARAVENGQLYARAPKAAWLRNIFPEEHVEFCLGIRDPATFLPALYNALGEGRPDFTEFLDGADPRRLRWSDYIARLQAAVPGCPITVWCNEDTPLIWSEVMREVAGLAPGAELDGELDIVMGLIHRRGRIRLKAFLEKRPPETEAGRRRAIAAYLEKYFVEDKVEQEIDIPGWTETLIDEISEGYDEDVAELAHMPGVTLIEP
ncbi:MAG: hypothetical protein QNJ13_05675 [Paracoccaceae bacterium]|nr:hypothetical protein [Paracoccaceae bacterium]